MILYVLSFAIPALIASSFADYVSTLANLLCDEIWIFESVLLRALLMVVSVVLYNTN